MIFKQISQVLDGTKTQTRRHFNPNAALEVQAYGGEITIVTPDEYTQDMGIVQATGALKPGGNFRTQYRVGKNYAVKPQMFAPGIMIKRSGDDLILSCDLMPDSELTYQQHEKVNHGNNWKRHMIAYGWMPVRHTIDRIRVERLQSISDDDALAEGLVHVYGRNLEPGEWNVCWYYLGGVYARRNLPEVKLSLISGYRYLWESINTKAPLRWQDNPLIPVYDFRITPATIAPDPDEDDKYKTQELPVIVAVYPVTPPELSEIIPIEAIIDDSQYLGNQYRPTGQYRVMECIAVRNTTMLRLGFDINPMKPDKPDDDYKPWLQYYPVEDCVLVETKQERAA